MTTGMRVTVKRDADALEVVLGKDGGSDHAKIRMSLRFGSKNGRYARLEAMFRRRNWPCMASAVL